MGDIWVYKPDGTIQCAPAQEGEISLETMQEQLEHIIGSENVLKGEKRTVRKAIISLCGAPTGKVNCYHVTEAGLALLFHGVAGPMGFEVWPNDPSDVAYFSTQAGLIQNDPETGPVVPWPLSDRPVPWPFDDRWIPWPFVALANAGPTSKEAARSITNIIASLTSVGAHPTSLADIVGRQCRVYTTGDMLTFDYLPERINIELSPQKTIVRIHFG